MHNEVIRTPWILTCPERIPGGAVVAGCVSQTSVLPTILDIAGLDIRGVPSAGSVKGLASRGPGSGVDAPSGEAAPVFSDTSRWISVVRTPFKLIAPSRRTRFPSRKEKLRHALRRAKLRWTGRGRAGVMLYDFRADPGERSNIASREKNVVEALLNEADRYYKTAPSGWLGAEYLTAEEEDQVRKELDRLGYL